MVAKATKVEQSKRKEATQSRAAGALASNKVSPEMKSRSAARGKSVVSGPAAGQRIRIKIKAYDHKIIDTSTRQIVDTALRAGCEVQGPVPIPTETRRYTVNRSTFVHKDSREQFEIRVHKRILDILSPTPKLIDALTSLNIPAGVDLEIKTGS